VGQRSDGNGQSGCGGTVLYNFLGCSPLRARRQFVVHAGMVDRSGWEGENSRPAGKDFSQVVYSRTDHNHRSGIADTGALGLLEVTAHLEVYGELLIPIKLIESVDPTFPF